MSPPPNEASRDLDRCAGFVVAGGAGDGGRARRARRQIALAAP